MGSIIKFPDERPVVGFGRAGAADKSAKITILPVIRIERYANASIENAETQAQPPTDNGGHRRMRRR